jgi:phosphatidylglycerophosphate synthase
MTDKLTKLWATKTRDDDWWSSFVTSPLAIAANYGAVSVPWITPNRVTAASFLVALVAMIGIIIGTTGWFIAAAILTPISHVLDCTDGQMARYRNVSSPIGSHYDRLTDQVEVALWYCAAGYAAGVQTDGVVPDFLAMTGIAFYSSRGYAKYISFEFETARDPKYPNRMAGLTPVKITAGLGFSLWENWSWFIREQRKILAFDEGVFIFMLSTGLIVKQTCSNAFDICGKSAVLGPLQILAQRKNIGENQKHRIEK